MSRLQLLKIATHLSLNGKALNPCAFAFILTEMSFRGPLFRTGETLYALWVVYVLRREPKITLGQCQVSFQYWREHFGENNLTIALGAWRSVSNYEVCCEYLQKHQCQGLRETLVRYNGRPSALYVQRFRKHLNVVRSTFDLANLEYGMPNQS
jgi:hypothetical protein